MFNLFKKKKRNTSLPLWVDIHSHLLPGLDDGVKSIKESMYILDILQKLGYQKVITTPHVMHDHYPNSSEGIISKLEEVKKALKSHEIKIKIEAAAEYFLDEKFLDRLMKKERFLTFGDNYILFETSFFNKPAFLEDAIFAMNTQGYKPVLAHPERYSYLQQDIKLAERLKNMNTYLQMNLLSCTDFYSVEVKKFARKLLKANLIDFVGSDCHNALQANEIKNKISDRDIKLLNTQRLLNRSLLTM